MNLEEYLALHQSRINQPSERLFVADFLYPLLGSKIEAVCPQAPFIDRTGRQRRIDFAYCGPRGKLALEVNGETYHAEGIIPNGQFDDNLFRQNEILRQGYQLVRFSYSQLQDANWRPLIMETLRDIFASAGPELLAEFSLKPTPLQNEALEALKFYRDSRRWRKGVVVLPTGTGKTILSALDARRAGGRVLFLVHRLDILKQSIDAFRIAWPDLHPGILTGESRECEHDCDVLFASKDTLRRPDELARFPRDWFQYIVVDEVHHGQSPTYREILTYFQPSFMLGMTATPDRMDRRDIFELFDYNKVFEVSLSEAIERGFLAPFTYFGLTDDIDYSRIRYQNHRYRVDDLENHLIIPERNEAVLQEYVSRAHGNKAIGFCVSIKHADRMAAFFVERGIPAASIHSQAPDRDSLIAQFRADQIQVAFTVDLFNEGVDFPNVRVLLFLRPTESKTVFMQQLGRGLRLCAGKDRVVVLDFIGDYKRANQIRKYLSKSSIETLSPDGDGIRRKKIEYTYSTGCEVCFDARVEEILNRQDAQDLGVSREELQDAYFALAERLGRKPSRSDLDAEGEFKSGLYASAFGSWAKFLREIGEYTEASYHYPQGNHLGHTLSLLDVFGRPSRDGTHCDDRFIRLRGDLGEGRLSIYRRQLKYKLQAAMELGILTDDRLYPDPAGYILGLTTLGKELRTALAPVLDAHDLNFPFDADGIPSTAMKEDEGTYNAAIRKQIATDPKARTVVFRVFLGMRAVQQMLAFLYQICRTSNVQRNEIYEQFFQAPFVKQFCDQEGIEEATIEASRRRCPFLLNVLDACGVIEAGRQSITVKRLLLGPALVRTHHREDVAASQARLAALVSAWPASPERLNSEDLSVLRELFGPAFLTKDYHLADLQLLED